MEISIDKELIESLFLVCLFVHRQDCPHFQLILPEKILLPYLGFLQRYSQEHRLPIKECSRCGLPFIPDYRNKRSQKYCYFGCQEWMRRFRRRERNNKYRSSSEYKKVKSRQNQSYQQRLKNRDREKLPVDLGNGADSERHYLISKVIHILMRFFGHLSPEQRSTIREFLLNYKIFFDVL